MLCPSCKLEGKETEMLKLVLMGHPEKLGWMCPLNPKHWEVLPREREDEQT